VKFESIESQKRFHNLKVGAGLEEEEKKALAQKGEDGPGNPVGNELDNLITESEVELSDEILKSFMVE